MDFFKEKDENFTYNEINTVYLIRTFKMNEDYIMEMIMTEHFVHQNFKIQEDWIKNLDFNNQP